METAILDEQTVAHIWTLLKLGSASSSGYGYHAQNEEHAPGSGHIFAYGVTTTEGDQYPAAYVYNAAGESRELAPITRENLLVTLNELGITETDWSL
jgi:hypothetical protein